jgi:hypothetical protein
MAERVHVFEAAHNSEVAGSNPAPATTQGAGDGFIGAADVERAVRFYSDVLGGEIVLAGKPAMSRSRTAGSSSTSAADRWHATRSKLTN